MNGADDPGKAPGAGETTPDAGASAAGDEPQSGEEQSGEPQSDEERARAIVEELRRLKVEDLALDMTVSLVTVGYQKLGLTAQTCELRDLGGAHLAIELLRALLDVLQREGAPAPLGDLRSTLATMQLEYARAVADAGKGAEGGTPKGGAPEGGAAEGGAAEGGAAEGGAAEGGAAEGGAAEGAAGDEGQTPGDPSD